MRSFSLSLTTVLALGCVTPGASPCERLINQYPGPTYCLEPSSSDIDLTIIEFGYDPNSFEQVEATAEPGDTLFSAYLLAADDSEPYVAWYLDDATLWSCLESGAFDYGAVDYYMGDGSAMIWPQLPFGDDGTPEDFVCLGPSRDNDGTY